MAGPKLFRDVVEVFCLDAIAASIVKYAADGRDHHTLVLACKHGDDINEIELRAELLDELIATAQIGQTIVEYLDGRLGLMEFARRLRERQTVFSRSQI